MSWDETRRRWRAIRDVEAEIDDGRPGELPWNERYAEVFGTREELLSVLEYRWTLIVQAQLDPDLPEDVLAATFRDITLRHAPLLGVLDAHRGRHARADLPGGDSVRV